MKYERSKPFYSSLCGNLSLERYLIDKNKVVDMTDEPRLTPEEAREYIRLHKKVSQDMQDALGEALAPDAKHEHPRVQAYTESGGTMFTDCTRNKYGRFARRLYLDGD